MSAGTPRQDAEPTEPGSPSSRTPERRSNRKRPAFEPAAQLLQPTRYDPDMPRPAATIAGTLLVMLGVVAEVLVLIGVAAGWTGLVNDLAGTAVDPDLAQAGLSVTIAVAGTVLVVEAVLGILIYRGHNWPRVLVMILTALSICTAFSAWWVQGRQIEIEGTFLSLSLDVLVLLALSSRSAAAYARRNERRR